MRFSCRFTPNLNIFWPNMSNSRIYLPNGLTFIWTLESKLYWLLVWLKLRSFLKWFLEGPSDILLSRRDFHSPFEWTPEYADFSNPTILHLKNVTGYMYAIWILAPSTQMFCVLCFCISCICQQCALFQEIHSLVCRLRDFRSFCNILPVSSLSWHTGCF